MTMNNKTMKELFVKVLLRAFPSKENVKWWMFWNACSEGVGGAINGITLAIVSALIFESFWLALPFGLAVLILEIILHLLAEGIRPRYKLEEK